MLAHVVDAPLPDWPTASQPTPLPKGGLGRVAPCRYGSGENPVGGASALRTLYTP